MMDVHAFRQRLFRISLLLIAACAGLALSLDVNLALGVLLGGAAGMLAIWLLARRVQQFTTMDSTEITIAAMRGTFVRLAVYAAALGAAYSLDPSSRLPLAAAVFGLLLPRAVMYGLAFTSLRQPTRSE